MVEGPPTMWDNLVVTFPKIKKFRNNKARVSLYDALGQLYDGHLAEGTYNFASMESPQEEQPLQQIHEVPEEDDDDATTERDEDVLQRSGLQRTTTASRNTQGKEEKRPKRSAMIKEMMERFLEMREEEAGRLAKQVEEESARLAKQVEEEAACLAREKEAAESNNFSLVENFACPAPKTNDLGVT
ncbi:hypothetical protein GQ55_2G113400 [Panicum hallii var. hallii]|uniref:Uncharacterized protein n=1 Tax=Panicum hallii var. hallii TaxID=1504633 RepID=A0A2T7ENU6_9POAL|nr:hypothetical protein GQ55_2G113400 [Panicum hallii var. hallii]